MRIIAAEQDEERRKELVKMAEICFPGLEVYEVSDEVGLREEILD